MGSRGPVPKRSEERRRENKPETPLDSIEAIGPVKIPPVNPHWHAVAKRLYLSMQHSAQCKFYEESDWSAVYLLAESISRDLKPQVVGVHPETGKLVKATIPLRGASLAAYLKAFSTLGVTEGDRRRMGIEIERKPKDKPALSAVTVMDEYRSALGG